jgi:hypothetical protein
LGLDVFARQFISLTIQQFNTSEVKAEVEVETEVEAEVESFCFQINLLKYFEVNQPPLNSHQSPLIEVEVKARLRETV